MFAEIILPFILIQSRHKTLFSDGIENLLMCDCYRIALVDTAVIRLPQVALLQIVIRLIEQAEDPLIIQKPVQRLLCRVNLIDHDVIVVWVLCADDDSQLIPQRDLRGTHGFHRIVIQGRLIREKRVRQLTIHGVLTICQRRVLIIIELADDLRPKDLKRRIHLINQRR